MKTLKKIEQFNEDEIERLLTPVWNNDEIIGETGVIIGEEGSIQLLGAPIQSRVEVKNIFGDVLYEEGIDYMVEGSKIKRIAGGNLPFFTIDDYFEKEPNSHIILKADPSKIEFSFPEQRYIYFSEGVDGFSRYITVSYEIEKGISPNLIVGDKKLQSFVEKLKTNKKAKILLYGDSITVGCNATGTKYGGNVSPYLPDWNTLMKLCLQKKYAAEITVCNQAVGGWSSVNGIDSFEEKCGNEVASTDLFCIGFGANDISTDTEQFKANIAGMIDGYFAKNPDGNVLLYSTLLPNDQAIGWRMNQPLFEKVLLGLGAKYERVGVAKISTAFLWLEQQGKQTRDVLANSVNHPNDFGVRMYAQVLLKTLLGEEFL